MIRKLIIGIVLNGAALYGVTYLLPNISYQGGVMFFVIGGVVMGVLNSIVKPIIKLVTFPLQILTLGISLIFINALLFWFFEVALEILTLEGIAFQVSDIKSYFLAGLLFGIINWLLHLIIKNKSH